MQQTTPASKSILPCFIAATDTPPLKECRDFLKKEMTNQTQGGARRPTPSVKSMAESWTLLFLVLWAVNVSSCKGTCCTAALINASRRLTGFEDLYIHAHSGSAVQAVWCRDVILFVDVIAVYVSCDSVYFRDCPHSCSGTGAKCNSRPKQNTQHRDKYRWCSVVLSQLLDNTHKRFKGKTLHFAKPQSQRFVAISLLNWVDNDYAVFKVIIAGGYVLLIKKK